MFWTLARGFELNIYLPKYSGQFAATELMIMCPVSSVNRWAVNTSGEKNLDWSTCSGSLDAVMSLPCNALNTELSNVEPTVVLDNSPRANCLHCHFSTSMIKVTVDANDSWWAYTNNWSKRRAINPTENFTAWGSVLVTLRPHHQISPPKAPQSWPTP